MKLNFKDLKQQKFSIDAEPLETVADVKQKVAAEKGFDAGAMRLIWSGKILADDKTVSTYDIKPADHIVCMVTKPKAAPVASKAPSTPAQAPAPQTPSAPAPAASTSATSNAPATPSPAPATAATPSDTPRQTGDPSMLLGTQRQEAITNMESMGFERAQCERAMRAAFYNADRAVEYLLNGIPESAERQMAQQQQQQPQGAAGTGAAATTPTPPQQPAQPAAQTGGADEPVNLFEAAAAAQGTRAAAPGAGAGAGGPGGATGAAAGGASEEAGGPVNLDFMRNNQTFQQLRNLVQQQPQMLESVLQQVTASNPQLAQMIAAQPEAFMNLLMEGSGGEEGDDTPLPPGAQAINVTEAERDAIERLCRLGFERDLVIQAYFACDKNEELAANFLFENPPDDM